MHTAFILMFALSIVTTPAICQDKEKGNATTQDTTSSTTSNQDTTSSSNIHLIFGGSFSYPLDDWADFKTPAIGDSTLFLQNDSQLRPALITGVLLKLSSPWPDILLSLKLSQDNSNLLNRFMLGFGIRITKQADLIFAFSRRLGKEASPGFQREAIHLVGELKEDKKYAKQYSQYSICNDELTPEELDGFPLYDPRSNRPLYGGANPIVDSYNSTLHLGIVVSGTGIKEWLTR